MRYPAEVFFFEPNILASETLSAGQNVDLKLYIELETSSTELGTDSRQ